MSILQALRSNGTCQSIRDLQDQLSRMQDYWKNYQGEGRGTQDDAMDDKHYPDHQYTKAATALMQTLIQVLVSSNLTNNTNNQNRYHIRTQYADDSSSNDDDDDDDDYCLLLSDQEIDQLLESLQSIPQVHVDGNALKRILIQQGRGVTAMMMLARQVLLYREDEPPEPDAFFYFASEEEPIRRR